MSRDDRNEPGGGDGSPEERRTGGPKSSFRDDGVRDERRSLDGIVPELLKRVIETGTKNLSPDTVQKLLGELKLPKDALNYTMSQLDETKSGLYRVLAKELHDVFERTNLADEMAKALSSLSLEVKMEVRFKPTKLEAKVRRDASSVPPSDPSKDQDD